MRRSRYLFWSALFVVLIVFVRPDGLTAYADRNPRVALDQDDIGGVVTSAKGPEAGVWVIAETNDLPTKFARIVVTDDRGRYVVPDLPRANYQVFVRGYGLLDSTRLPAKLGQQLDLKVELAPGRRAAAQVYPAGWWLSMITLPDDREAQRKFTLDVKVCLDCHQLGTRTTREIGPKSAPGASSTLEAWDRRTKLGPSGPLMGADFQALGEHRKLFADWTDRIAKGEAPRIAPPRPSGVERNLVITEWDWGTPLDGRADNAASDVRDGRINANGLVFGASQVTDGLNILDPVRHTAMTVKVPSTAPTLVSPGTASPNPSPYWGDDIWKHTADPRSVAIDGRGRVWIAARGRANQNQPAFCRPGSNPFGQYYPLQQSGRQLAVYDPKTRQWADIDTCFSADHNQISADNFIYFGMTGLVGWIDINTWDRTHDTEASQGWCPLVLDTNMDGKITKPWTEPREPGDPAKDHRGDFQCYSIAVNPKDGSLWCSGNGRAGKMLVRLEKGPHPPDTCRAEMYMPPNQPIELYGVGGVEADSQGNIWQDWRTSGHFTSFNRNKCPAIIQDPNVTGQGCPEGWVIYRKKDDPTYGNSVWKSNQSYLTQVDFHDALGLGKDAPMYGSINTDSLEVLSPKTREFVTLRVPYPLGFFTRSANGRIDDPNAGWKGRGLWAAYSSYAGWHTEGGPGTRPKVVKFQMRPNPLAK